MRARRRCAIIARLMPAQPYSPIPIDDRRFAWAGPLLLVLSAAALLARGWAVPVPVFMGDEYYYIKTTELWFHGSQNERHITGLPGRGTPEFPNVLFFAVYAQAMRFGDAFYAASRALNVLFAAGTALLVFAVARRVAAVPRAWAWGLAALTLWLPASTYLAYFTPEALHDLLVWLGIAAYLLHCERRPLAAAAGFGAALGAAFLVKPNAIALLVVANVVVAAVHALHRAGPGWLRRGALALLALNAAFVATGYLLQLALSGHWIWQPFGAFYAQSLANVTDVGAGRGQAVAFAKYAGANLGVIAAFCGVPLTLLAARWQPAGGDARRSALVLLGVAGPVLLALASAKVSANWERTFVDHLGIYTTRYIHVLFPLLLCAGLAALTWPQVSRRRRRLAAAAVLSIAAFFVFGYAHIDNTLQMRELHWASFTGSVPFLLVGGAFLGVTAWHALGDGARVAPYVVVMVVNALAASLLFARFDHARAEREPRGLFEAARSVRAQVPRDQWDDGVVVSLPRRRAAAYFMTSFPGIIAVRQAPADQRLSVADLPPGVRWVALVGEHRPGFDGDCQAGAWLTFCWLKPETAR